MNSKARLTASSIVLTLLLASGAPALARKAPPPAPAADAPATPPAPTAAEADAFVAAAEKDYTDHSVFAQQTQWINATFITVDGAESRTAEGTTFGLHLGSDFAYYVLPKLALTGGVQMGYGTVTLREPLSNINQQIRVGNTRVCMGVRFALGR